MIEYVFATLTNLRLRQGVDFDEAMHTAAIFMTTPIMALFVLIDIVTSNLFNIAPLFRTLGKWPYGLLLFGLTYFVHYYFLIRGGRGREILSRVSTPDSQAMTLAIALSYVLFVPALSVVIGYAHRQG